MIYISVILHFYKNETLKKNEVTLEIEEVHGQMLHYLLTPFLFSSFHFCTMEAYLIDWKIEVKVNNLWKEEKIACK